MKTVLSVLLLSFLFFCCHGQENKQEPSAKRTQKKLSEHENDSTRLVKAKKYEDSIAKIMQWKPLKDGWLYVNKFGDIGFKSYYHISAAETVDTYRIHFNDKEKTPYKNVIDTATFKNISPLSGFGTYFKDKNHIYHYWGNSGGGNFYIADEVDLKTFRIIGEAVTESIKTMFMISGLD